MLHIKGASLEEAYKKTFFDLLSGERYDDPEIHREDSAVIEVDASGSNQNLKNVNKRLVLKQEYSKSFPFIESGLVEKEMEYWNDSLVKESKLFETIEYLRDNPLSKRAIILFWDDKYRDLSGPSVCEIAAFFRKKGEFLDMHTMMRANNVSFLLYMDMDVLTGVQSIVSRALNLKPGKYIHFVNSLHFYREEIETIEKQANFLKKSALWNSERNTK